MFTRVILGAVGSTALGLAWLLSGADLCAADRSGVSPQAISLPSGPGSIEGLGESFEPQLNSGTFSYQIPLKLPPVRGGAPSLSLSYSSGSGNGFLGLGWTLRIPCIRRQTEKGLPTYESGDLFIDENAEELVPLADGHYRQKNEGLFIRYERAASGAWIGRLRNGTTLGFGATAQARLDWEGHGTFCWMLEFSQDSNGNRTEYSYRKDGQQIYPDEIRYGLHATELSSAFSVRFAYSTNRPDPWVDCRPRFSTVNRLRLETVTAWMEERRIRLWRFGYHSNAPVSLLASVSLFGDQRSATNDAARANRDFLPPTLFDYTRAEMGANWQMVTNRLGFTPDFNSGFAEVADLNHDGLPDILLDERGEGIFYSSLNPGGDRPWPPLRKFASPVFYPPLNQPSTRLVDLSGDGRGKLLVKDLGGDDLAFYFRDLISGTELGPDVDFRFPGNFPLDDTNVQFIDLNGDKAMDLMAADGDTFAFMVNGQSNGRGDANRLLPNPPRPPDGLNIRFSDGWRLADMNGDRLLDLVRPGQADIGTQVCLNLGWGHFASALIMQGGPSEAEVGDPERARLQLVDLDQDGLSDLVYVDSGRVRVWLNGNATRWKPAIALESETIPDLDGSDVAVRFADMNGNGSTDVVWASRSSLDLRYLELNPAGKAWLLRKVITTQGRTLEVTYRSSVDDMLEAVGTSDAWTSTAPFPVSVVGQIVEGDGLGNAYTNQFTYRNAYYDGLEREFRGFEQAVKRELGDDRQGAPTLVTDYRFDTGAKVEALKGKPLEMVTRDDAGGVFWRQTNEWTARVLPTVPVVGELRVNTFAFQRAKTTRIFERQSLERSVVLQEEFDYDNYGNLTRHADWGRLDAGDPAWDDERVRIRSFSAAFPSGQSLWLLDRVVSEELQDESGAVKTRKHYYYDDETFAADNPGRISKGNLTLVQEWVDPGSPDPVEASRHRLAERHHYDAFGNVVRSLDPLGVPGRPELGHQRSVELDGVVHSHPVKETVFTANPLVVAQGERAPRLEMSAEYDLAFGVLTRATDFNGNRTQFDFDPFGRLVAITKPGDSPEFPTASFQYQLAEPLAAGGSVNWIETRLREVPGGPGTFDSRKYLDGLGRALMVRTEGERPGEVVVSGATVFNRRRGAWKTLLPYFERGTLEFHSPVLTNVFTETIYDSLGRTVGIYQPATAPDRRRAYARTTYGPLSRLVEDEEQTRDGSVHAGAAMRFTDDGLRDKDGNPRLRQVEEIVKITDDGHSAPDPRPWVTRYRYDLLDNLAHLTDSQGNQKSFRYDALSRKLSMDDPDRGVMFWVYDDASNLVETRDAKQQVIRFNYDGVNRLLAEDYLDLAGHAPDVSYAYDVPTATLSMGDGTTGTARNVQGMLAYVRDLSGEEHTSYDARARIEFRVKQIRDPAHGQLAGFRTGFEYDSLDRITRLTYPDNDHIRYQYNNRNLLERVAGGPADGQSAGGNIITGIAYQASGQMSSIDYGNGVRTSYTYDPRLRLMELHTRNPSQAADLIHFAYEFDDASNIRAIRDRRSASTVPAGDPRRNTQIFSYDDLYRLTRAGYSFSPPEVEGSENGFISYRYDRIGNMLQQSSDITHLERGVSVTDLGTMVYGGSEGRAGRIGRSTPEPGPHALSSILPSAGSPRLYPYDANGNMTVIDGLTNTWDFKDRLVAVESSEMRAEYGYDYTDRRVVKRVTWKVVSTNNTSGANPGWVLYPDRNFEVREHNAPVKYVWNGDTRVARVTGNLNASERVQRVILRPGWNVVALAVTLSDGASQFSVGPVQQVFRHGANPGQYSAIRPNEVLPAGTILRVQSSAAVTLGLRGVRSDPAVRTYPAGRHWVANSDFEPLEVATRLPADAPLWFWDAGSQDWRHRFVGLLNVASDHPSSVAPGEALFAVNASPFILGPPDPALEIRYYHQDHLGSSSVMSDASGQLVNESAYYPFGHPRMAYQPRMVTERYQFTQKERDGETGMQYFEARTLAGGLGVFTSIDNVKLMTTSAVLRNPQEGHLYRYAKSNPMAWIDPTGCTEEAVNQIWSDVRSETVQAVKDSVHGKVEISRSEGPLKIGSNTKGEFSAQLTIGPVKGKITASANETRLGVQVGPVGFDPKDGVYVEAKSGFKIGGNGMELGAELSGRATTGKGSVRPALIGAGEIRSPTGHNVKAEVRIEPTRPVEPISRGVVRYMDGVMMQIINQGGIAAP